MMFQRPKNAFYKINPGRPVRGHILLKFLRGRKTGKGAAAAHLVEPIRDEHGLELGSAISVDCCGDLLRLTEVVP